jgi:hypothetical protein
MCFREKSNPLMILSNLGFSNFTKMTFPLIHVLICLLILLTFQKVSFDVKLPILYLIDSIVKNVGNKYKQLFAQNIVNIFCGVFEKVKYIQKLLDSTQISNLHAN